MAKSIAVRAQRAADEVDVNLPAAADASLPSAAVYEERRTTRMEPVAGGPEPESSARMLTPPLSIVQRPIVHSQPELVPSPSGRQPGDLPLIPAEPPRYASRSWHAEAWERERERELHAIENRPDIAARRHSSA